MEFWIRIQDEQFQLQGGDIVTIQFVNPDNCLRAFKGITKHTSEVRYFNSRGHGISDPYGDFEDLINWVVRVFNVDRKQWGLLNIDLQDSLSSKSV